MRARRTLLAGPAEVPHASSSLSNPSTSRSCGCDKLQTFLYGRVFPGNWTGDGRPVGLGSITGGRGSGGFESKVGVLYCGDLERKPECGVRDSGPDDLISGADGGAAGVLMPGGGGGTAADLISGVRLMQAKELTPNALSPSGVAGGGGGVERGAIGKGSGRR
uniref:Uncharacterized protein n=1 Tax=Chromera velia CCMP2878 TaxID=1169474 RepID=A0A0G4F101_9ALVE|eukprot:Cvel_14509.t1-p1 / transcript=Cvel_14509.t1 / gene=Cvel_14509 / organism=Chromera_velia_CCMP2878 / gene_product=hypothetical protein / transcript_product=hypothetical protein / location=Cvel_scaffold1035:41525-42010(+) / protein_length=162 / sequence_SO=supercontig / SO=protein_coding / is_pseudo=false